MRRLGRAVTTAIVIAVIVAGSALVANAFWTQSYHGSFRVAGSPAVRVIDYRQQGDLAPGRSTTVTVELQNRSDATLVVSSISSTESQQRRAAQGCPVDAVSVTTDADTPTELPAHVSSTVPLQVTLAADAPSGCQGATVPLTVVVRVATP